MLSVASWSPNSVMSPVSHRQEVTFKPAAFSVSEKIASSASHVRPPAVFRRRTLLHKSREHFLRRRACDKHGGRVVFVSCRGDIDQRSPSLLVVHVPATRPSPGTLTTRRMIAGAVLFNMLSIIFCLFFICFNKAKKP